MKLILPISGKSTRYKTNKPKWLMTHPYGDIMLKESIKGINTDFFDEIIISCLKEHYEKYDLGRLLKNQFGKNINITVIKESKSQADTIYQTIKKNNLKSPISIKDCDNYFDLNIKNECNYIAVADAHEYENVKLPNKSFVKTDVNNIVSTIAEKQIIGNIFCVGNYGFENSLEFLESYENLNKNQNDEIYISHIIYDMMLRKNKSFVTKKVNNYIDWGTFDDWENYIRQYGTLFVDLDGTLVKSSSEHYPPFWGDTEGLGDNINVINEKYETGKYKIIITTARKESYRDQTIKQLEKVGVKYHDIIFNLPHSKRYIINDYSTTNPYKSCESINLKRDNNTLREKLI